MVRRCLCSSSDLKMLFSHIFNNCNFVIFRTQVLSKCIICLYCVCATPAVHKSQSVCVYVHPHGGVYASPCVRVHPTHPYMAKFMSVHMSQLLPYWEVYANSCVRSSSGMEELITVRVCATPLTLKSFMPFFCVRNFSHMEEFMPIGVYATSPTRKSSCQFLCE